MAQALRTSLQAGGLTQGGLRPGLGGDNIFASSALDLNFGMTKSLGDLVTFTRASSGTYVGSDGLLKTATTNYLLRSEEFDNASWFKNAITVTADAIQAPSGLGVADKLVETTAAAAAHYVSQGASISSTLRTISVYAKAGERTQLRIEHTGNTGNAGRRLVVNLSSGVISSAVTIGSGGLNSFSESILAVGSGWYKIVTTIDPTTTTGNTGTFVVQLLDSSGQATYTGDGTSGLYLWGAQLEQSSTVGEYIPTTSTINSAPRFDHNPTTGESLGLLVEEQRTNLVTSSATFQPSSAGNPASYTVDQVAPDGTTTASRQTATNPRTFVDYQGIANAQYTFSVYAKAASGTVTIALQLKNAASDTVIATGSNVTLTTAWQRLTITGTTNGATTGARIEVIGPVVGAPAGTVFWGAQLEAGAFPTSYIPTTTATATRSADVASITGSNFSSWYNSSASTLYSEAQSASGSVYTGYVYTLGADFNNAITHYRQSDFQPVARIRNAGVDEYGANGNGAIWTGTSVNKFALAISPTSGRQASNGSLNSSGDDSSITAPSASSMTLGALVGTSNLLNGTIRRLCYWGQRLPNSTLQTLTQ